MMHGDVLDPTAQPALVSSDRSTVVSSALLPMATEQLLLAPTEYSGEHGTCVCGRVVILRGPVVMQDRDAAQGGGGAGKGVAKGKKGRPQGPLQKTEVHLLGGTSKGEVLFMDAWGDAASQLKAAVELEGVYCISGARVVQETPRYSTSKLPYFLRVVPPIGTRTKIARCTSQPWTDLPLQHPFTNIGSLDKVQSSLHVCLVGVLTHQPGVVARDTAYGRGEVCNAVLKQGSTDIRCSFWRQQAQELAKQSEGAVVALMQVNVKRQDGSWTVSATEATQVSLCDGELATTIREQTDLDAPSTSLSRIIATDFETVSVTPAALSTLMSVIVPQQPRALDGVFDIHNVAIMGVGSVLPDDELQMQACSECKRQVNRETLVCDAHPLAAVEERWLISLELADHSGSGKALLYHDAASALPFLHVTGIDAKARQKVYRAFRSTPWSARCVFKTNDVKQTNYLEIKKMTPTLTEEGRIEGCFGGPLAEVAADTACPFARCADVSLDSDLGVLMARTQVVAAVRLLVRILPVEEDEAVAVPDPGQVGLRVTRQARCALRTEDEATYALKAAGLSVSVQWLATAPAGSVFLVTAMSGVDSKTFKVLAYQDTQGVGADVYARYMNKALGLGAGVAVAVSARDTPLKRMRAIEDATPVGASATRFSTRVKVE